MRYPCVLSLSTVLFAACSSATYRMPAIRPAELAQPPALGIEDASEPAIASPRRIADGIGKSYTKFKLGTFVPDGDLSSLDDGLAAEVTFGRELLSFLAIEGSLGYVDADGQFGSTQLDFWAIPVFVNARASLPVLIFEPYAGAGVGGIYADYQVGSALSSNDFVLAWDAFIGLEVGLGGWALGAEYKYLQSEDTKDSFAIEGSMISLFVSVGF